MKCPACLSDDTELAFGSADRDHSHAGYSYSRCRGCGTHFLDPPPSEDELYGLYAGKEYPEASTIRAKYLSPDRRMRDHETYIAPLARYKKTGTLLDFGCGDGWFTDLAQNAGYAATGMDVSDAAIAASRAAWGRGMFMHGCIEALPHVDQTDVVAALSVLEHLHDPAEFLSQANRTLASDGVLMLQVPVVDSLMFEHLGEHYYWVQAPRHVTLFSREGLAFMLAQHGFRILESRPVRRTWYWTRALADKVGVRHVYDDVWRGEPNFVEYDIALDKLLDDIAYEADASASRLYFCRKDGR